MKNNNIKVNIKISKNDNIKEPHNLYNIVPFLLYFNSKYIYLYPKGLHTYTSNIVDDNIIKHDSILLYNSPNKTIMRWYPFFHENIILFDGCCLNITSTHSTIAESALLYSNLNGVNIGNINNYSINSLKNSKQISSNYNINEFLLNKYPNKIKIIDDAKLYEPDYFKECLKSSTKCDICCIDIIHKMKSKTRQISFASSIFLLMTLKKGGTFIFFLSVMRLDLEYSKQIIYLFSMFFGKKKYFNHIINPDGDFLIFEDFVGIGVEDFNKLFSVIEKWYSIDKSGGHMLEYSDKQITDALNLNFKWTNECIDQFVTSIFDFKYSSEYEKEFNKIIKKSNRIKDNVARELDLAKELGLDLSSDGVLKLLSEYSINDLKRNVELAHHYGLPVKPKYLDYNKKIEDDVIGHLYSIDDTIIHEFQTKDKEYDNSKYNCHVSDKVKVSYQFDNLTKYKTEINMFKFMTETRDWKRFQRIIKKIGLGYEIRKFNNNIGKGSRAFFKMYELLVKIKNPSLINEESTSLRSLHICEAPGKFISATNNYVMTKTKIKDFKWNANSLNFEVAKTGLKDQYGYIKKYPNNWLFGKDGTGDITKVENIKNIVSTAKKNLGDIMFMTSDCGMDVSEDYNAQELLNSKVGLAHVIIALMSLAKGGNVVFKVFLPLVECISVSLVYLLYCYFDKISFVKQISGSPYNSEIYIVCNGYIGSDKLHDKTIDNLLKFLDEFEFGYTFFNKKDIPDEFIIQYTKIVKSMMKDQKKALLRIFYLYDYHEILDSYADKIEKYKQKKAIKWTNDMNIMKLDENDEL